jgi:hypothetical protein
MKTVFEDVEKSEVKVVTYEPKVKQMVRKFGAQSDEVVSAIETVDAELSSWINVGWKLSFVERAATEPDGYTVLYILTKD